MKTKLFIYSTTAAAAVLIASGCAGGRSYDERGQVQYKRSTGQYIDDKALEGKVKAALIKDKEVKASDVTVDIFEGVVQLSGFVDTAESKQRAEEVAKTVAGVTEVKNNITLKPGVEQAGRDESLSPTGKDGEVRKEASIRGDIHKASKVMGMKVENLEGEKLGDLQDFVIDSKTGRMLYAVVTSGGIFGLGDKNRVVPPSALKFKEEGNNLSLDISKARWKNSPSFDGQELNNLGRTDEIKEVYRYYEIDLPGNNDVTVKTEKKGDLSPTGKDLEFRSASKLQLASDLMGKRVYNEKEEKIGHVKDLLVDFGGGKGAMAVVETDQFLEKDGEFVIPASAFQLSGKQVVLNMDKNSFTTSERFESKNWPNSAESNVRIYKYDADVDFDTEPTGKDLDVRVTETSNQDLVARIKSELTKSEKLSSNARNLTVYSEDGKIVVKGIVDSEAERKDIMAICERLAGSKVKVNDEIKVK